MPRADYNPYPTFKPEGPRGVVERVDINYPHVDFSNAVGKALAATGESMGVLSKSVQHVGAAFDNLGSTFEGVGNELWKRAEGLQEVQNQTTLTKAEIEYDKYAGEKQIAFNKLQGEAATEDSYKAHLKDLEDKRQQMLGKLPNQSVQQRFDKNSAGTVGRYGMQAAEHAATETRKALIAGSEARVDQLQDQISKETDINNIKTYTDKVEAEILGTQAPAKGWGRDKANMELKKQLGSAYVSMAVRMSRENPTAARELLEANVDNIDKDKYNQAMEHVGNNERIIQSNNIGNEVQEANPDGTLPEKKAEAKKKAEAMSSDPRLIQAAVDDAEQKHMKYRREQAQQKELDNKTIWDTAYGHTSPHGEVPTNAYELFAYGGEAVRKIYESDRFGPTERHKVDEFMKRAARGDVPETEATRHRVWQLEDMWMHQQGRFRDHDIESEQIPLADRSRLRTKQIQVIKEGIKLEADPKTADAINKIRTSVPLPRDLKPGSSKWPAFSGMVREGLIELQKQQGYDKPLTEQQIKNLGNEVLEKVEGSGYWGNRWNIGAETWYESAKSVPNDVKEQMKIEYPGITEGAMLEKYQHLKTIMMFNKRNEAQSAKPAQKPPEPPPEKKVEPPVEEKKAEKPEKTGPQKPDEKRSEFLGRKVAEFRSSILTKKAREAEEAKKQ